MKNNPELKFNFADHTKVMAFFLAANIFVAPTITFAQDDSVIEIPSQILVISSKSWNNREINLLGNGSRNLLVYSYKREGALNNSDVNGAEKPIYIFAGYYDGSLENNEIVDVTGNSINVDDGGEGWLLFEIAPDDSYNRLHIYDTNNNDLKINIIGARSGYGKASGNEINIFGGTLNGYVIAAENKSTALNPSQNIFDNTINIFGNPNLREIKLYGAALFDDDTREHIPTFGTNNTLNFYTKNIEVTELNGFNNYNFYLPDSITHRDIVLNVIGDAVTDISGSKIFVRVPQVETIDPHEKIILIQNISAGIDDDEKTSYIGVNDFDGKTQWQIDPVKIYEIDVDKVDDQRVAVEFISREFTHPAKFIPRIRIPGFLNGGGDFLSDYASGGDFGESADVFGGSWNTDNSNVDNSNGGDGNFNGTNPGVGQGNFDGDNSNGGDGNFNGDNSSGDNPNVNRNLELTEGSPTYIPFFAMSHGSTRYKNSNVDISGTHLIGGFSRKFESKNHRTFIAPMIEYGRGNFDSHLSSGEHGTGNSQYLGGGIVFRSQMSNGVFYDGSIRAGRIKNDFESADFGVNGYNVYEKFHSNSPYIGAHFGIGRTVKRGDKESFTYYGKLLFSHTASDDIEISSGEDFHLSHVNSERIKIGIRDSYEISTKNKIYAGLAFQYEFGGASYAEHDGLRYDAPSIRGSSGIFEIGWIIKPYGDDNLSLDLSGTGTFGKQRGLSGRCGLNWNF